jgi:hypothetical protein
MKKILFVLVLLPIISFSQISSWRNNTSPTQSNTKVTTSNEIVRVSPSDGVSSWRRDAPSNQNNRPNVVITRPYYNNFGWNRWDMWGAPTFGWNYWNPMWYWNDWGYRQPARIYVYKDGKQDTIKGKKPIISFGLHHTTNKQLGAFFTVGNKGYFIMDFTSTYEIDRSTFFPYGRLDIVDFPLIDDLVKSRSVYLGAGKRFKRTGFHAMLGFGNERILFRGKDAVGEITFPKSNTKFTSIKIGVMHDFKNLTLKFDSDPIRGYSQFGVGMNF